MDCQLIATDARFLSLSVEQRGTIDESVLLTDQITFSYLWVLGAYEFTRTLHQRLVGHDIARTVQTVKHSINRLRVPLAKMEAAARSPSDSPIAYPALNEALGIAWQISEGEFITRRELADQLLNCLETYAALQHER
jgi:hypothetical protein